MSLAILTLRLLSYLDDQQKRLMNIVLNKVAVRWDDEALGRLLGELQADWDLVISGFNQEEFEDLVAESGTVQDTEIEVPVVRMILTSKVHWTISSSLRHNGTFGSLAHWLMCGDSLAKRMSVA